MDEQALGLVLRTYPLTETSLIVHWLTEDAGRISTVAKGARRPNSPFRGKLDLYFLADFSFRRSRHSDLHLLKEVRLRETHPALRENIEYLAQAAYVVRLLEMCTESETPLPAYFQLLTRWLSWITQRPPWPVAVLVFELELLKELGLAPNVAESPLTTAGRQWLAALANPDWTTLEARSTTGAPWPELARFLGNGLMNHLGRLPKGRPTAGEESPHW
jgi:DNA repair protein RecO (recombination protein O)